MSIAWGAGAVVGLGVVLFVRSVIRNAPALLQVQRWEPFVGKHVAVKSKGGPDVYMGVLIAVKDGDIHMLTTNNVDLHLYIPAMDVQAFGTYDPEEMAEQARRNAMQHLLMATGGGNVPH